MGLRTSRACTITCLLWRVERKQVKQIRRGGRVDVWATTCDRWGQVGSVQRTPTCRPIRPHPLLHFSYPANIATRTLAPSLPLMLSKVLIAGLRAQLGTTAPVLLTTHHRPPPQSNLFTILRRPSIWAAIAKVCYDIVTQHVLSVSSQSTGIMPYCIVAFSSLSDFPHPVS